MHVYHIMPGHLRCRPVVGGALSYAESWHHRSCNKLHKAERLAISPSLVMRSLSCIGIEGLSFRVSPFSRSEGMPSPAQYSLSAHCTACHLSEHAPPARSNGRRCLACPRHYQPQQAKSTHTHTHTHSISSGCTESASFPKHTKISCGAGFVESCRPSVSCPNCVQASTRTFQVHSSPQSRRSRPRRVSLCLSLRIRGSDQVSNVNDRHWHV